METVKEENEKKKEYLKQYGKALRQEKRIEEELERLKLDRMLPGALAAIAIFTIFSSLDRKSKKPDSQKSAPPKSRRRLL